MNKSHIPPVVVSTQTAVDPIVLERAFACLRNSHTIEHQAIAALKSGQVSQAKQHLQRQIQMLVSVLALL